MYFTGQIFVLGSDAVTPKHIAELISISVSYTKTEERSWFIRYFILILCLYFCPKLRSAYCVSYIYFNALQINFITESNTMCPDLGPYCRNIGKQNT